MIDLEQYGYVETERLPASLTPGRVTEHHGARYGVVTERGELTAVLTGNYVYASAIRADLPCVGDYVTIEYNDAGDSRITGLLPRRSKFSRADAFGHAYAHIKANREQIVAVNFDYVFILSSLNWDFNINRVMRYITQARQSGGQPVVLLTKSDLTDDFEDKIAAVKKAAGTRLSLNLFNETEIPAYIPNENALKYEVPVHAISVYTGFGLDALNIYLRPGKTVVFLGMSGVGKSSLINKLMERDVMDVKAIRDDDSRGRHATTHRQLFMLPSGAMVIDTPGMRELGLFDAGDAVSAGFTEVEHLTGMCRFSDCRHKSEPGCAVMAAIEDGSLTRKEWERYMAQKKESKFYDDKNAYMREKSNFHKSIAKNTKTNKKTGRKKI